jgi:hypothetical protein
VKLHPRTGLRVSILAAIAVSLVLGAGPALAASATVQTDATTQTDPPSATDHPAGDAALARIQAASQTQIDRRLAALNTTLAAIAGNTRLSSGDKATLTTILTDDVTGLTALRATIAADTTAAAARAHEATIFTGYRVYALALPQVRFASAADGITGAAIPALTDAQKTLAGLLAGADSGKNTPAVQARMADLATQLGIATSKTDGLAATVLGYTPAQYNANHALLAGSRTSLAAARVALAKARADILAVETAIA